MTDKSKYYNNSMSKATEEAISKVMNIIKSFTDEELSDYKNYSHVDYDELTENQKRIRDSWTTKLLPTPEIQTYLELAKPEKTEYG